MPQVFVDKIKVNVKQHIFQCNLLVVVLANIEVVAIHRQNSCTGPGAGRVNAKGILGAIFPLVANDCMPTPYAVLILVTPDQGKGLHGIFIWHIVRRAGADGHIQAPVEGNHLPNGAAINAVLIVIGRIIKQIRLVGNLGERLLAVPRMGGGENLRAFFGDTADNQLTVELTQAPDARTDSGNVALDVILPGHTLVYQFADVRLWVHLINAGQAVDRTAKIELPLVLTGVAEQAILPSGSLGHQQRHISGDCVHLDQNAACRAPVFFTGIKRAIVEHIQNGRHGLRIEVLAQGRIHQGEGIAHGIVAGGHIHVVPMGNGRPRIALPTVALALVRGGHHAIPNVIHNAVYRLDWRLAMRNLGALLIVRHLCLGRCRHTKGRRTAKGCYQQRT